MSLMRGSGSFKETRYVFRTPGIEPSTVGLGSGNVPATAILHYLPVFKNVSRDTQFNSCKDVKEAERGGYGDRSTSLAVSDGAPSQFSLV